MITGNFFVFDTNVLISAIIDIESSSATALFSARKQGRLLISHEIAREYLSVFYRKKFDKWISFENRINFIENIIENSMLVDITRHVSVCRDAKDNMFLSLAVSAQANFIITGDKDLLTLHPFDEIPVLSPVDFLKYT
jgi:putative PIN family toxin of toxin-antitoxin system